MRGGGVGFYIREGLNFKIIDELSPFEEKIFESLTLQLSYSNKKSVLPTCAYRSNGLLQGVTPTQQMERFSGSFEELFSNLSRKKNDCFIFMDSNIDLLKLADVSSSNLLNTMFAAEFLQTVYKATRFQNASRTLIDHIFTSCKLNQYRTGTILADVSDHFFTFIAAPSKIEKFKEKTNTSRQFTTANLDIFKTLLGGTDWQNVLKYCQC